MPPNRMVALFTPVIGLAAGAAAAWLADAVPGLNVTAGQMEAVFVAGLVAVLAPAAQWLYGSQKHERHQAELEQQALAADTQAAALVGEAEMQQAAAGEDEDDGYDDPYEAYDDDYDDPYEPYEENDDSDGDDDDDYEAARAEQSAPVG